MCGISGVAGDGWTTNQLKAMVCAQHHRGPDDAGVYVSERARVGLGHNRLSIIDLSSSGHQPMSDVKEQIWLTFNGEIYNYIELRQQLRSYSFKTETDSEVILAAYMEWGESCVDHFVGMFAFAIWDEKNETLFCARDRLGIKPFHYAEKKGCLYFSSEIKAILVAGIDREPDFDVWATYLKYGYYDHSERTFFKNVRSLSPGHTLVWRRNEVKVRPYWDLPAFVDETRAIPDQEAILQLTELFDDSVRLRLRSDVPLGVNVSGGLDSAGMLATVDKYVDPVAEINTFTATYNDPQYDEDIFAEAVPKTKRWHSHLVRLSSQEVGAIINESMWHQEAPIGGIATLGYHKLHRAAKRNGVTVLLEGQGVDELFAGYRYFRSYHLLDLLEAKDQDTFEQELKYAGNDRRELLDQIEAIKSSNHLARYQDGTEFLQQQCVTKEISSLLPQPPEFTRPFTSHLRNALFRDLRYTKLPRVLRMNDRLSMASSRELREPYLDHRFVQFAFGLSGQQKIYNGASKHMVRQAMADRLPDSIRMQEKRSVVTPQREWIRNSLKPFVKEVINSSSFSQRGFFDVAEVKTSFDEFCRGKGDNSFFIWQWINTEYWFRAFYDQQPVPKNDLNISVRGS